MRKLDVGIDAIEWQTFAGSCGDIFTAAFRARANSDQIRLDDQEAVTSYFRAHIERGVAALRTVKSLAALAALQDQIARSRSGS